MKAFIEKLNGEIHVLGEQVPKTWNRYQLQQQQEKRLGAASYLALGSYKNSSGKLTKNSGNTCISITYLNINVWESHLYNT